MVDIKKKFWFRVAGAGIKLGNAPIEIAMFFNHIIQKFGPTWGLIE
jgi:hypothetical protein